MQKELNWFASFPKELRALRGKHVALLGKKVVAFGDTAKEVLEKSRKKYPHRMPVLTYIPKEETLILWK